MPYFVFYVGIDRASIWLKSSRFWNRVWGVILNYHYFRWYNFMWISPVGVERKKMLWTHTEPEKTRGYEGAYLRILELCKLLKWLSTVQSVAVSSSFCRPWRFFPWIPRGPPPLLTHNKPKIKSCRRKSMRSFWAIHYICTAGWMKNWLHRGGDFTTRHKRAHGWGSFTMLKHKLKQVFAYFLCQGEKKKKRAKERQNDGE